MSYHTSAQVTTLATCKKYHIVFKIILINFKEIHGLAPAYTRELISVRDTGRYDLRSNDGLLLAPCKGKTLTTLGDRCFTELKVFNFKLKASNTQHVTITFLLCEAFYPILSKQRAR